VILRRVVQHVKDQNWFAVGIDFVIVVVGVFIGIQVSNWNSMRADVLLESEILSNIVADLQIDERELSNAIQMADVNLESGIYALTAAGLMPTPFIELPSAMMDMPIRLAFPTTLTDPAAQRVDSNRLWRNIVFRYHPTRSASAFDTLVATGRLGLISNRELVRQLQLYQGVWKNIEISQSSTLRHMRDQAVFVGQKFGLSPFGNIAEDEFIELLCENPELQGAARTLLEYSLAHRAALVQARELTRDLIEQIQPAPEE